MRRHLLGLLAVASVCGWLSSAQAQATPPFSVSGTTITQAQAQALLNTLYGAQAATATNASNFASAWNQKVGTFDATFEQQINSVVQDLNYGPITSGFANAAAMATKGMAADYATDYDLFTLTFGAGSSVHGVSLDNLGDQNQFTNVQNNQTPDKGLGLNISVLAGINLGYFDIRPAGWFDPKRLSLYLNVFAYDSSIPGLNATANMFSFGLHGTYRIIDEVNIAPAGLLHWGGFTVGTGFNINNYTLTVNHDVDNLNQTQKFTFDETQAKLQLQYEWVGNATVELTSHGVSIPFEASTNIQLLYFLTLYGGVGVDLNFGSTSAKATSNAPVSLQLRNENTGAIDNQTIQPVAHFNLDTPSYGPTVGDARAFGGFQINIVVLALFGQVHVDSSGDWGLHAGARAFW